MADIRVGESINFAMLRTATVLFKPFNFKKYAAIAWLAMLMLAGDSGAGGSVRFPTGGGWPSFNDAMLWIKAHLVLIIAGVLVFTLLAFAIYLALRW